MPAPSRRGVAGNDSYFTTARRAVTDPDNRSVVTGVAFFAAGVAFLHSSFADFLLPM